MPFDSECPGDTIAAPFCGASNREGASIESPAGRTWDRLDGRSGADEARPPRDGVGADGEPTRFAGRSGWITSIGSIIADGGRKECANAGSGVLQRVGRSSTTEYWRTLEFPATNSSSEEMAHIGGDGGAVSSARRHPRIPWLPIRVGQVAVSCLALVFVLTAMGAVQSQRLLPHLT